MALKPTDDFAETLAAAERRIDEQLAAQQRVPVPPAGFPVALDWRWEPPVVEALVQRYTEAGWHVDREERRLVLRKP